MMSHSRVFVCLAAAVAAYGPALAPRRAAARSSGSPASFGSSFVGEIADPVIRSGVEAAIAKNLRPAATQKYYPGFFEITADGRAYGGGATWPGLDSWDMAGAYLLLGRTQLVLDYFDFVRASQRADGAIPMAIFPAGTPAVTFLRGLNYPDDVFTYRPPARAGVPLSAEQTRSWIGLFEHWQPKADPLSTLGSVCYILTAAEIYDKTRSREWLSGRFSSVQSAAQYLLSKRSANGLISGSGYYQETPPRYEWDGVTQCEVVHAFDELARLAAAIGDGAAQTRWNAEADKLARTFIETFWRKDHFGEYVSPTHGLVDTHGLSDVNWAAVAFGIVQGPRLKLLWTRLMNEPGFWAGGVPTQDVTNPFNYQAWELNEPLPFKLAHGPLFDVAAMGRVWYLEAEACVRMHAVDRLVESTRLVCQAAVGGTWRERYLLQPDGQVLSAGARKYGEYPAVLIRVVLGHPDLFCRRDGSPKGRP